MPFATSVVPINILGFIFACTVAFGWAVVHCSCLLGVLCLLSMRKAKLDNRRWSRSPSCQITYMKLGKPTRFWTYCFQREWILKLLRRYVSHVSPSSRLVKLLALSTNRHAVVRLRRTFHRTHLVIYGSTLFYFCYVDCVAYSYQCTLRL